MAATYDLALRPYVRASTWTALLRFHLGDHVPQSVVDAILPARAVCLKVFQHRAINAERHKFSGTGWR